MQNIYDEGYIKHGSDISCMCDAGHMFQFNELFAMRKKNINEQPDEGVCNWGHTLQTYELFVIRQHNRNGQSD